MKLSVRQRLAAVIGAVALAATACGGGGSAAEPSEPPSGSAQQSADAGSASAGTSSGSADAGNSASAGTESGSASAGDDTEPKELRKLRYGISGDLAVYWHVYAGQELGIFQDNGIDLEKVTTRTGSATDLLSLLIGNEVDMVDALPDPAIAAAANKADVAFLNLTAPSPYSLVARKGIESFDDVRKLAAVKVAVSSPTTSIAGLSNLILDQEGIDPSKVELVVTGGTSARLAALQSNSVDLGLLVQPADFKAESAGMKILGDSVDYAPWYGLTDIVKASTVNENCDLYKDFFTAMGQVNQFLTDPANKDEAIDIVVSGTGADRSDAELTYELYMKDDAMPSVNDPTDTITETSAMLGKLGTKVPGDVTSLVNTTCSA